MSKTPRLLTVGRRVTQALSRQEGVLYKDLDVTNAKFIYTSKAHAGREEDLGKFHAMVLLLNTLPTLTVIARRHARKR